MLVQADAAFVGTLISKGEPTPDERGSYSSLQEVSWRFRVTEEIKGDIGREVVVRSPNSGASCGFDLEVGQGTGVFLDRRGGAWTSGLCRTASPEVLRRVAKSLPEPGGRGRARFVLGGSFGNVRTMTLDGRGRPLAYGGGEGTTRLLSVCPGSRRVAEAVFAWNERRKWSLVAVRDLASLDVVGEWRIAEVPVDHRDSPHVVALSCRDPTGRDILVYWSAGDRVGRLERIRDRDRSVVNEGTPSFSAAFSPAGDELYVGGRWLERIDPGSGLRRRVAGFAEPVTMIAPSPDGRMIAGVTQDWRSPDVVTNVFVHDLTSGRTLAAPIGSYVKLAWLDAGRIAVVLENEVRVYDAALRSLGTRTEWQAIYPDAVVAGEQVLGFREGGQLVSAPVLGGETLVLGTFDGELAALVGVPPLTDPLPEPESAVPYADPPVAPPPTRVSVGVSSGALVASAAGILMLVALVFAFRRRSSTARQ